MKIVFYPQSLVPFHGKSLGERPLGGTETGVIRIADALHRMGHQVVVFTSEKNPPKTEPPYFHISQAKGLRPVDAFICIREWIPLVYQIPAKKKFLWTGDAPDQVHNFGIGDKRVSALIDGILTVSEWHSEVLSEASGFPREKCFAIKNGVHLPYFESYLPTPRKPRLIYASTPFRGLEHLPRLFPEIRKRIPNAELHVFSGFDVYKGKNAYSPEIQALYKEVFTKLEATPGVTLRGNVNQEELAKEFLQARVLAYPNTFKETSCIVVMEAQAAGCVPVTTRLGALSETVGDCGVLVDGVPATGDYDSCFVSEVVRLLKDDKAYTQLASKGRTRALAELSWDLRAKSFITYLNETHGL